MALNAYLNKRVSVLTLDGRTMVGLLHSCDGSMNLVLQEAVERIIRPIEDEEPSEEVPLGLYIIRGDSVAVVGRVDEEIDGKIDWGKVHGEVLGERNILEQGKKPRTDTRSWTRKLAKRHKSMGDTEREKDIHAYMDDTIPTKAQ
ncbi:unnamed protein product [Alternaria alternata]